MTITTCTARRATHTAVFTFFIAAGGGIGFGSAANAQTLRVQRPFSLMLGGRGATGQDGGSFYAGGSYAFAKSAAAVPAAGYTLYQVYADYAQLTLSGGMGAGSPSGGRNTGPYEHSLGIGPAVTFHFSPPLVPVHPFVGVGAGYYTVKADDGSRTSRFGGKIFAGVELKSGFLGEVDYSNVGTVEGIGTGGIGLRLGYRF